MFCYRLAADRKRQEELARQRMEALRNKMKNKTRSLLPTISEDDEVIVTEGGKAALVVSKILLIVSFNLYL